MFYRFSNNSSQNYEEVANNDYSFCEDENDYLYEENQKEKRERFFSSNKSNDAEA